MVKVFDFGAEKEIFFEVADALGEMRDPKKGLKRPHPHSVAKLSDIYNLLGAG